MSKLSGKSVAEVVFWLCFAGFAYYFSQAFEKQIEIYKFGAFGWPRAIIVLIAVAAVCQLVTAYAHLGVRKMGTADSDADETQKSLAYYLRVGATFALPLLYALLLESIGFYTLTPILILGLLLLSGERRIKYLIGITAGVYAFFVFVFGRLLYINLPVGNLHPFYDFSNWLLVIIR